MTSVKELIGTEDFLQMNENDCMMESHRECVDRNVRQKCGCGLWEDSLVQVGSYLIITIEEARTYIIKHFFRAGRYAARQEETASTMS